VNLYVEKWDCRLDRIREKKRLIYLKLQGLNAKIESFLAFCGSEKYFAVLVVQYLYCSKYCYYRLVVYSIYAMLLKSTNNIY